MLRWSLLMLVSAGSLAAQFHWTCDPKDGKFITALCANCKKFYCWDGKIFSEEPGYTPPPGYVLSYWEEVHRRSQQIRDDIDRRGKELREQVQKGAQDTARLNQERAQTHKEFMDDLNRRIAQSHSPPGLSQSSSLQNSSPQSSVTASNQRAAPKTVVVVAPQPAIPAPSIAPTSRAKVSEVQVGMDRDAVEGILGKPHGAMSVPEDDGLVETLTYRLDDRGTARVRIEKGKVVSVKISE